MTHFFRGDMYDDICIIDGSSVAKLSNIDLLFHGLDTIPLLYHI